MQAKDPAVALADYSGVRYLTRTLQLQIQEEVHALDSFGMYELVSDSHCLVLEKLL